MPNSRLAGKDETVKGNSPRQDRARARVESKRAQPPGVGIARVPPETGVLEWLHVEAGIKASDL